MAPLRRPRVILVKVRSRSDSISPPLGLGYLARALAGRAEVQIIDAVKDRLEARDLADRARRFGPDLIGLSVTTPAAARALDFARVAKTAVPSSVVVAGGPHPTALPVPFLDAASGGLDAVLVSEAEQSLAHLVVAMTDAGGLPGADQLATIDGIVARTANGLVERPPRLEPDLDALGFPAWELMPPATYPHAPHGAFFRRHPVAPIITSRGCSFDCTFCASPFLSGRSLRFRSPASVVEEVRVLCDRFGIRELQIIDDNFTTNQRHALGICEAIIDNGLVMPWSCPNGVRADCLEVELLVAMREAGCYSVSLGLESAAEQSLAWMNKRLERERVLAGIERARAVGLEVNGLFLLGTPGDTRERILETVAWAQALPLQHANFALFAPFPGSPAFDQLGAPAEPEAWRDVTFADVGHVPRGMTAAELKSLQRHAYFTFYAHPRRALGVARAALRSASSTWHTVRRASNWLGPYRHRP